MAETTDEEIIAAAVKTFGCEQANVTKWVEKRKLEDGHVEQIPWQVLMIHVGGKWEAAGLRRSKAELLEFAKSRRPPKERKADVSKVDPT